MEPEDPPGKRVSYAVVLSRQSLAHVIFELPGLLVRGIQPRARLWGIRLRRFPSPHPLDRTPERIPVGLHLQNTRQKLSLELVAVLHIGTRPQGGDQLRQQRLGSQVPGVP